MLDATVNLAQEDEALFSLALEKCLLGGTKVVDFACLAGPRWLTLLGFGQQDVDDIPIIMIAVESRRARASDE